MSFPFINKDKPVLLVGGGALGPGDLAACDALVCGIVAADSGADKVVAAGRELMAVIGDLDSVSRDALAQISPDRQHYIAEQDSTDFDKALRNIQAPLILAAGFCGARLDHQLAVLHTLYLRADRPCILLGEGEITFICPPRIELPTRLGETVSLFPLVPLEGRSEGLEWPINGLKFHPGSQIGTSNRALGTCRIEMDAPGMITMVPRRLLPFLTAALISAARWPARTEAR